MTHPLRAIRAAIFIFASLYAFWLALLIVHELGHIIHAVVSGARVERVLIPLLGFSRTDLAHNPHPVFVAWGGSIAGALAPGLLFAIARRAPLGPTLRVFAAVSLLANGGYACSTVGDARDILRSAPRWPLLLYGTTALAAGLILLRSFNTESVLAALQRPRVVATAATSAALLAVGASVISHL